MNLCPYYPLPNPLAISEPAVLAGIVGTAILIPALIVSLRWTRALLTGWLFFFTAILPTMGIIRFTVVIASDKYAYLPSVGLVMVLAWLLSKLWTSAKTKPVRQIATIAIVLLVGVFESVVTIRCYSYWQRTESLANRLLSLVSDSPQVYNFAAYELARGGKLDEAIEYYHKTIEISTKEMTQSIYKPTVTAHYNLGIILRTQNKLDEAIEHFSAAVRLRKSYTAAHRQLAKTLALTGRANEAVQHYKAVVELEPEDIVSHGWLGMTLAKLGRIDEALVELQFVLAEQPNDIEMHRNVGILLEQQGHLDEAIEHYRRALEIDPNYSPARKLLEAALAKQTSNR